MNELVAEDGVPGFIKRYLESFDPPPSLAPAGWIATEDGCQLWSYDQPANVAAHWTGACVDGKAEGQGEAVWLYDDQGSERRYRGLMLAGRAEGEGVLTWRNGDRYEGSFASGIPNGSGLLSLVNGRRYRGDFVAGFAHGDGVLHDDRGGRLEGAFANGLPNGRARIVFPDGAIFEGSFMNGRPGKVFFEVMYDGSRRLLPVQAGRDEESERRLTGGLALPWNRSFTPGVAGYDAVTVEPFPVGPGDWITTFEGCSIWSEDRPANVAAFWSGSCTEGKASGEGRAAWLYGDGRERRYHGPMHAGQPLGKGEMTFADGSSYQGEWRKGKPNGLGVLSYFGQKYNGRFVDGRIVRESSPETVELPNHLGEVTVATIAETDEAVGYDWPDGRRYYGNWEDGRPHGTGRMIWPRNGSLVGDDYYGDWAAGKRQGSGTMTWAGDDDGRGPRYLGQWQDDKRSGRGTMLWPTQGINQGAHYTGEWRDNVRHGTGVMTYADGSTYEGPFERDKEEGRGICRASAEAEPIPCCWRSGERRECPAGW